MRRRMELNEFKRLRYAGKSPDVRTLKNWIDAGKLPGCKEFGRYWVFIDELPDSEENRLFEKVMNG